MSRSKISVKVQVSAQNLVKSQFGTSLKLRQTYFEQTFGKVQSRASVSKNEKENKIQGYFEGYF